MVNNIYINIYVYWSIITFFCSCFNQTTSADEVTVDAHKRASFPEFLEMIGRVSRLRDVTLPLQDVNVLKHMMLSKSLSYAFMFNPQNDIDRIFQVSTTTHMSWLSANTNPNPNRNPNP